MSNFSLANFGMAVLENAISVAALEIMNVSNLIPLDESNTIGRAVLNGVLWTLADELIYLIRTGRSNIIEGHYVFLADQLFFNSALFAAIDRAGVGELILDVAENFPIPAQYQGDVASGVIKVATKTLQDVINQNYANTPLIYLTQPHQLVMLPDNLASF